MITTSIENTAPVVSELLQLVAQLEETLPATKVDQPSDLVAPTAAEFDSLLASW